MDGLGQDVPATMKMRPLTRATISDPQSFIFAFIRGLSIFWEDSALRGRIALPGIEEVCRTPALVCPAWAWTCRMKRNDRR